ncbi:MAG: hypothetical protein PSX37_10645, partial [bacterium]|nr:hypothetical protein [bacterium]
MTRHPFITRTLVGGAVAAALTIAAGISPARADTLDLQAKTSSWDKAAAKLGTAGSLWDPMSTAGLKRVGAIDVAADGLTFARGRALTGDTVAAARYGRGATNFSISEKWANTGWAAEPAFTTSMAKVGTVLIPVGLPGTRIRVKATVYANCFVQPTNADPTPVPKWFKCARSQVLTTGGVLTMTARPSSTMTAPGNTSIVIQTSGLSYAQLISIAAGLQQVAGASADGAGSAQMVAMCKQMVTGRMTFDQA